MQGKIVRRFDIELVRPGRYVVAGGVAYNEDFLGRFTTRDTATGATNGHA